LISCQRVNRDLNPDGTKLAFLYTTFPRPTETFVRRELTELNKLGIFPSIYSIWKGKSPWEDSEVRLFKPYNIFSLFFWLLYWAWKKPRAFKIVLSHLWSNECPNLQNWNEAFWGLAFGLIRAKHFNGCDYERMHAVWATMPASAALAINQLVDIPFSMGAHAYDVFRHQGDWMLQLKLKYAKAIRTSSRSTAFRLTCLGLDSDRLVLIHRSLKVMPERTDLALINQDRLSLLCVGRLVEKKGYFRLIEILKLLAERKIPFHLDLIGSGPLKKEIILGLKRSRIDQYVNLRGYLSEDETVSLYLQNDVLLFPGIVASNGDRDGIPNVIPESMAAGLLVLASNRAGSSEAFDHKQSGFSLDPYDPAPWVDILEEFYCFPEKFVGLRKSAMHRAREIFSGNVNCQKLKLFIS
jgi:colanic acid/amylovoran biosynthesis glycosyltransferase